MWSLLAVQIILSCWAACPDPRNSHHTVTKSQIIRNSTNNYPISFSCRLWIPSIFHIKSYIFMIMTWRAILVFEISARNVQFLPEILGIGQNIRIHSVNMTCRSILVFEISARNVQFLPEILGSGQKHNVSFGKYDMSINSRFCDFCSKCSVSARNLGKWSKT